MSAPFDRAVLLFNIESVFRTYVTLAVATDAYLVENPDFTTDITKLERNNVRTSLSPQPSRNGRILSGIKFSHEVRGSGNTTGTVPPDVGRLLRSCGFAQTQYSTAGYITRWARAGNLVTPTWGGTGTFTGLNPRFVTVTITTAGAPGTAVCSISSPALELYDGTTLAAVAQTGVSIGAGAVSALTTIGAAISGLSIQVRLASGSFTLGESWVVLIAPAGYLYTPISTGFESGCADLFYDGLRHRSTGMRGTVKMNAEAGKTAKFEFEFKGDWVDPVDAAMPTDDGIYSEVQPPQVELAQIFVDSTLAACPAKFGFDMKNSIQVRECANSAQGYAGALITERAPTVNFDPEFNVEATYAYWAKLKAATEIDFTYCIGTRVGNMCQVISHMQIRQNGYGDRSKQRIYNIEGDAVSRAGNDEISLYFC